MNTCTQTAKAQVEKETQTFKKKTKDQQTQDFIEVISNEKEKLKKDYYKDTFKDPHLEVNFLQEDNFFEISVIPNQQQEINEQEASILNDKLEFL